MRSPDDRQDHPKSQFRTLAVTALPASRRMGGTVDFAEWVLPFGSALPQNRRCCLATRGIQKTDLTAQVLWGDLPTSVVGRSHRAGVVGRSPDHPTAQTDHAGPPTTDRLKNKPADHPSVSTKSSSSPSGTAIASMLLSFVSRPYSMSRTVAGFGIPAALATAYHVSSWRSRAARIFAPIPCVDREHRRKIHS